MGAPLPPPGASTDEPLGSPNPLATAEFTIEYYFFTLTQVHPLMFSEPLLLAWSSFQHMPVLFLPYDEIIK